jgi:hypothetical protein
MFLRTGTKDENIRRRTLVMVAARDRGRGTLGSRTRLQRSLDNASSADILSVACNNHFERKILLAADFLTFPRFCEFAT